MNYKVTDIECWNNANKNNNESLTLKGSGVNYKEGGSIICFTIICSVLEFFLKPTTELINKANSSHH